MINTNTSYDNMFNSVAREFVGRVELLEGSTLVQIFPHDGALISFTIDKAGNNAKFFGYGICQKATVKLRDKERAINIQKGQGLQIAHGIGNNYIYTYPIFYVDEVSRDEKTNELTITAYDAIYKANSAEIVEVIVNEKAYTLKELAVACAGFLGMPVNFSNIPNVLLDVEYVLDINGSSYANLMGKETIREVLDDIAEMFGAIYYLSNNWELTFQQLDRSGKPVLAIDKSKYFDLTIKSAHTLQNIVSVTELGDNIISSTGIEGETQSLRENVFLTLRDDAGTLLDNILTYVAGLTIYQFNCKHRGDFRVELGDKISLTTKDNQVIESYVVDDSITYNGGIVATTKLEYSANGNPVSANPSTLGEALRETYARVDKATGQITLLAGVTEDLDKKVASIEINSESITQTVSDLTTITSDIGKQIGELERNASLAMTPEDVSIIFETQMAAGGVDSVITKTGFTFNEWGLTIDKENAETQTRIDETGMNVYSYGADPVLQATSAGVKAKDLKATTYLHIGSTRFEETTGTDGGRRTGCFWTGGIS